MEKVTFPNGLRVLMEQQDHVRSVSFGFWIKSGSSYETAAENGVSHFMEHMAFKGTAELSARQIAEEMDAIGGQMNAYTTREYTCYYGRTLTEHLEKAFAILAGMVTSPKLDPEDIRTEKSVIMEEISMMEDMPEDRVAENQYAGVWRNSSYGRPILGSRESLKRIGRAELKKVLKRRYSPDRIVAAVCGNFDRGHFLDLARRFFGEKKPGAALVDDCRMSYTRSCMLLEEDQEQTHICLCLPGLDSLSSQLQPLNLLNLVTGGSTSSRLFQRLREELGLAYSVDSGTCAYLSGGLFEIQTAVNPEMAEKTVEEILQTLEELKKGVTFTEFSRAREQLKAGLVMGMENASSRVGHMGRGELLKGRVLSEDELLHIISGVTMEEVNWIANQIFDLNQLSVSVVGPKLNPSFYEAIGGVS